MDHCHPLPMDSWFTSERGWFSIGMSLRLAEISTTRLSRWGRINLEVPIRLTSENWQIRQRLSDCETLHTDNMNHCLAGIRWPLITSAKPKCWSNYIELIWIETLEQWGTTPSKPNQEKYVACHCNVHQEYDQTRWQRKPALLCLVETNISHKRKKLQSDTRCPQSYV